MFDKNLFDRNAFDRSVSSDSIDISVIANGNLDVKLVMRTTVPLAPFRGSGHMAAALIMRQQIASQIIGIGKFEDTELVLRMPLTIKFSGTGKLTPELAIRVPIPTKFYGIGAMAVSNQMIARQYMTGTLSGIGAFVPRPVLQHQIISSISGAGDMITKPILQLPLTISLNGSGQMILNRIGALNENVIELIGINLLPGETVIIDTDLLLVIFGTREDVEAVTSDSVFFELFPGINEVSVSTDTEEDLDITAIWQNRWL